jgi:hypothetical protein
MAPEPRWPRVDVDLSTEDADPVLLRRLILGDVAVVRLRGLLPSAEFDRNRAALRRIFATATTTHYANGTLTTIGPFLAKYLDRPDEYFAEARAARERLDAVGFDLAAQVRAGLAKAFGLNSLEPAREPGERQHGESVVRVHADGVSNPLHNDNIMRDAAGTELTLAELRHQLSCVVCIEECDTGGELHIYRRPWRSADERFKVPGHLGYDHAVVEGAPRHVFKPQAEDVYLINPTNYHEIARVGGSDRTTLGFFIGFDDDALTDAVVWG